MKTSFRLLVAAAMFLPSNALTEVIPGDLARQYFQEMESISDEDGGSLWGKRLYGPMLFVDPQTRSLVANRPDAQGHLTEQGEIYVGTLPNTVNVSATAMEWAGVRWTILPWPLPPDAVTRRSFMAHESFHRIQESLGLPIRDPISDHLGEMEGRIWLQLEWRALARALGEKDDKRRQAVTDALLFRRYRHSLYERAPDLERALDLNEGLAEYTGVRLSGLSGASLTNYVVEKLSEGEARESFARAFAYTSGPAYGLLLDSADEKWRDGLSSVTDIDSLLGSALKLDLPEATKQLASSRASDYGGESLRAVELEKKEKHERRLARYKARLIDGPILALPRMRMRKRQNPSTMMPLGELGTIHVTLRVVSRWGILEVTDGALIGKKWITVPAPETTTTDTLIGSGWTLFLEKQWTVKQGDRPGDFAVVRSQ